MINCIKLHFSELYLNVFISTLLQAHIALAECERRFKEEGRNLTIITQNIDGLHLKAGSKNVMEIHGSLFETKCTRCGKIEKNFDSPICKGLEGREFVSF